MSLTALPQMRIEIGLTGPSVEPPYWVIGDPDRGMLGTAAIGSDDIWDDITQWVRSWSLRRGVSRAGLGLRYEAGTMSIELNNSDRRFDPTNLVGPYTAGGVTQLTPMVRVRITGIWNDAHHLITGFADRWVPDNNSPTWSTVTLTATDAFKVFASIDRVASVSQGLNELSSARFLRVLDSAGWPNGDRTFNTGDSRLQATTLEGNVLSELQLVQDSEMGELYVDVHGDVVFRNRHAVLERTRSTTSQATFGDAGIANGETPYAAAPVDMDDTAQANTVTIGNVGGIPQTAVDATSVSRYLTKTYNRTDLLLRTDAEALDYAKAILYQNKDPELRFQSVSFVVPRPDAADIAWPQLLDRELGDRVTVIRRPVGGGDPIEQDCFVRGIEYASDGERFTTTFQLQAAEKYAFFTIGDPVLGRVGLNALSF
jgi:hypothetical protein